MTRRASKNPSELSILESSPAKRKQVHPPNPKVFKGIPLMGSSIPEEYVPPKHGRQAIANAFVQEILSCLLQFAGVDASYRNTVDVLRNIASQLLIPPHSPTTTRGYATHQEAASVAIHFIWKRDWPAMGELLPINEKKFASFHPRPHWRKPFAIPPAQLHASYKELPDFVVLSRQFDRQRKFNNAFLGTEFLGPIA